MKTKLHYQTINPLLKSTLKWLMADKLFAPLRLVGGTALSLRLGHRQSVDIDLFTDVDYGSIDFSLIDYYLEKQFKYADSLRLETTGFGKSYFIGESATNCIKLDLFYTDKFIRPFTLTDNIRFADLDDIVAMKMDVVARGARKKDFWDLHELLEFYSIADMIRLHYERYPYSHNKEEILANLSNFEEADNDFDPICLKGKYWELIKLDIVEALRKMKQATE